MTLGNIIRRPTGELDTFIRGLRGLYDQVEKRNFQQFLSSSTVNAFHPPDLVVFFPSVPFLYCFMSERSPNPRNIIDIPNAINCSMFIFPTSFLRIVHTPKCRSVVFHDRNDHNDKHHQQSSSFLFGNCHNSFSKFPL